ncbi:MAG: transcription antitermination factor NusB [Rhabdochlamydiaceae bacterium]
MTLAVQKLRELVFQILYSWDFLGTIDEALFDLLMKQLKVTKKSVLLANNKVELIRQKVKEFDATIEKYCTDYKFERITTVEKNILRLALYEMLYDKDLTPQIAMKEAVRLGRKFATPEGSHFVNGVLDAVFKSK